MPHRNVRYRDMQEGCGGLPAIFGASPVNCDQTALNDWVARAAAALTAIAEEAQRSSGPDAALDLQALVAEYEALRDGRPTWGARCAAAPAERSLLDDL